MDTSLYATFFDVEDGYWWSVGTRAIFREWLQPVAGARAPWLLDIGCGSGILAHELSAIATVTALDSAEQAMEFTRQRGLRRLCMGTAEQLPFKSACFDAVTAADIIEHTDDQFTLREIARVLKPGAAVLINVPAFPILWGDHDEVNHHRRRYRRAQLRVLIEESGLRIERLSYINCLLFPVVLAVRLGKRVLRRVSEQHVPAPEIYNLPAWANHALTALLGFERALLRWTNFPFGVSLLCLARKNGGRR